MVTRSLGALLKDACFRRAQSCIVGDFAERQPAGLRPSSPKTALLKNRMYFFKLVVILGSLGLCTSRNRIEAAHVPEEGRGRLPGASGGRCSNLKSSGKPTPLLHVCSAPCEVWSDLLIHDLLLPL